MASPIQRKEQPGTEADLLNVLHPLVKKWFFSRFKEFSLPQLFSVTEIHSRKNILVSAPTGATKTLTAFLSVINELVDSAEKGILENRTYAVYISPLKALNNDIEKNLKEPLEQIAAIAGKPLGIRVAVRTSDTTAHEKQKMTKNAPHILITTPESLAIILTSPKMREHVRSVQWLIVDEIHALADNKRGVHLAVSTERLQRLSPGMARVGLSATIAPLEDIAQFLVGQNHTPTGPVLRPCVIVDVQFLKEMDLKVISPVDDLIDTSHALMQVELYKTLHELIQQHRTTLVFTNTRSATERVVHTLKEFFPKDYDEKNIGAHHGSLSKPHRFELEENLRQGKLKCVVCSTSLELGIDIGYIDLVLLLGSPKSVARALQRIGRSGHQLHATTKGRIVVLNRDDLVECSVLLKSALEKKIDRIHIPENCLDVLVQHIHGLALEDVMSVDDAYRLVTQAYCFRTLQKADFMQIVEYLAGRFISLEDRHVYAKIWHDEATGMMGKRGKLSRVIHMTNIGTIPDQSGIKVKVGEKIIGVIDEHFLERLKPNDIFVLGGETYRFLFARGMTTQVQPAQGKQPTVPSWFSEMLPLSFDLAMEIGKFRRYMEDQFKAGKKKEELLAWLNTYLYVDERAATALYHYFKEQFDYVQSIPSDTKIIIEHYTDEHENKYVIFHTLFGRRVNDCLSRALGFAIGRTQHRDIEMGISDNGFYLRCEKKVQALRAFKLLKSTELRAVLNQALDKTEILIRRFRQCAARALMILRQYKGFHKNVGRQHISSMILLSAVRRISPDFFVIKETKREVLEEVMDIEQATRVLRLIENKAIKIEEIQTVIPTPFALNLVLQGHLDLLRMEDRAEFLKRMHQMTLAKIGMKKA
ncbi:MAG: ATP-dependent helicase [Candidatus Woesearchaeota archaeon]|nr:ATP-dependent helicase [Candidatus Woesearchaeota archaeon]